MRTRLILCPTDFSEASMNALKYAVEMANFYRVGFCLLHVISKPYGEDITTTPRHEENFGIVAASDEELKQHMKAYASEKMNAVLEQLDADLLIRTIIRRGSAAIQILEESQKAEVGMIVLGMNPRSAFGHIFQPSVAEDVIKKAQCPVLVVKGPA
jgi:universal stress protein A